MEENRCGGFWDGDGSQARNGCTGGDGMSEQSLHFTKRFIEGLVIGLMAAWLLLGARTARAEVEVDWTPTYNIWTAPEVQTMDRSGPIFCR